MVTGSATVFVVGDLPATLAYYGDRLGCSVTFTHGEPTYYACLCREEFAVHLVASTHTKRLPGQGAACLFVEDVDAIHAELVARGAKVSMALGDRAHGMRDFNVVDLDGNELIIGMATKP